MQKNIKKKVKKNNTEIPQAKENPIDILEEYISRNALHLYGPQFCILLLVPLKIINYHFIVYIIFNINKHFI